MSGHHPTTAQHLELIHQLAHCFYKVVPEEYRTYCAFTSEIIQKALTHFGVTCERVPCQIWYTRPDHIYVIGFLGKETASKWDGHVVCCAEGVVIDAAIHHFEREFGLAVPWMVTVPMLSFPTPALAQMNMSITDAIWWQPPPEGAHTSLPDEPQALVQQYAEALIKALSPLH